MKKLPSDLQHFSLDLSFNNLGENCENIKWLMEGIK